MNSYSDRLKQALEQAGVSVRQLSADLGISYQAIYSVLNGGSKSLSARNNEEAARRLGVSSRWLASGIGAMKDAGTPTPIDLESNPDYPAVRRVRLRLSAGIEGFAVESDVEDGAPIVFKRDWFVRHGYKAESLVAIGVKGSSMEPGMYDGDTVVINTAQQEPRDGRVFAINYEGELVIKRLQRDEGEWWMESDNPDQRRYPRKRFTEGAFIIGEIVHKQSERI